MSLTLFKALADETRLRLVHILFHHELSVNELVRILGMGQSRVSRHLKILAGAGLLSSRRDGLWVFYSAPAGGVRLEFLRAIMPYLPDNEPMRADLDLARRILDERAQSTRRFFNAIADDWDALNHEILGDFDLAERVASAMPPDCGTAADLGCGAGEVLERMLSRARLVIGVDGSSRMLELCRGRLGAEALSAGRASLRIGDLSHLPLADREAQFACVNLALHHLPAPDELLAEARRILSPGGAFFLADFARHSDESMRVSYGDYWLGFEPEDLSRRLARAGLKVESLELQPVKKGLTLILIAATAAPDKRRKHDQSA